MIISGGKVFSGAGFDARDVYVEGGVFAEEPIGECSPGQTIDASNCWVIPGLIDVHFHGAVGRDFCDAEDEGIAAIARYEASQGVTALFPTTMTLPEERLVPIVSSIAEHSGADDEAAIVGINMEGPFISPGKVGAQNPSYVRGATMGEFERWQEAAQGKIKLVDVAPEEPGNLEFIREAADRVRVSLAHMCADYETAAAAFDAGARDGTFELGGQLFTVHGNRATIENGSLAGSVSSVMACLRTAVTKMGIPLADAVRAATMTPAKALGIEAERGSIAPGKVADAVVLDEDLQVKHVILRGKLLF